MSDKDEKQQLRYIPNNVIKTNRLLGFKKRNLIEGVVWAVLFCLIINAIPFVAKVKIIIMICAGIAIIIANGFGIKGYAFSTTVIAYLQYKYYLRQFSFRRLRKYDEETKPAIIDGKVRAIKENKATQSFRKFIGQ